MTSNAQAARCGNRPAQPAEKQGHTARLVICYKNFASTCSKSMYVNQQNSNHELLEQTVTCHRDNLQEESTCQVAASLKLIYTYITKLNLNHRHMFILCPYQAQCNIICEILADTSPEIHFHNSRDTPGIIDETASTVATSQQLEDG